MMQRKGRRQALAVFSLFFSLALPTCGGAASSDLAQAPYSAAQGEGGLNERSLPLAPAAPLSVEPTSAAPLPVLSPSAPGSEGAAAIAPVWQPLARRLANDGLAGPQVDSLLATLAAMPSQSPMGRKMRELYMRRFFPRPPSDTPVPLYYKGVVTSENARLCKDFITAHKASFQWAESRYGVPAAVAVALLFVETRLGKVLADVPENAFFTLASMSVSREPATIPEWLGRMPGYEQHLDWFAETMPKRADWAYVEVRALVQHMLRDGTDPRRLPSSIYGAVGLCQFMPSNISAYGADGDGDGRVDLFTVPDAIASLANYLAKHGWRPGLSRTRQHELLMTYNHSRTYANTIQALADVVEGKPVPAVTAGAGKGAAAGKASGKAAGKAPVKKARAATPAPASRVITP